MEVAVRFRPVPHVLRGLHGDPQLNVPRFELEPESLAVEIYGVGPRAHRLVRLQYYAAGSDGSGATAP